MNATPEELASPDTLAEQAAGKGWQGRKITAEGEVSVPIKVPVDNRGGN